MEKLAEAYPMVRLASVVWKVRSCSSWGLQRAPAQSSADTAASSMVRGCTVCNCVLCTHTVTFGEQEIKRMKSDKQVQKQCTKFSNVK